YNSNGNLYLANFWFKPHCKVSAKPAREPLKMNTAQHGVHADGWILTAKMAFSWLWVLSVSGASLVPPAAGIP
ncbi:MAG: hypothetical protein ACWGP1_17240, partial [Syntrophobacteria bacterium]